MVRGADPRKLKAEAAEAAAKGKHKKALEKYLELERLEPHDGSWSRRAGEMYRQLGRVDDGIAAFQRAADKYADHGLVAKASAVCQTILRMRPGDGDARARLDDLTGGGRDASVLSRLSGSGAFPAVRAGSEPSAEGSSPGLGRARSEPPPAPRAPPRPPAGDDAPLRAATGVEAAGAPARRAATDTWVPPETDPEAGAAPGEDEELEAIEGIEEIGEVEAIDDDLDELVVDDVDDDDEPVVDDSTAPSAAAGIARGLDRDAAVREVLAASPLFAPLPPEDARTLLERFELVWAPPGESVVSQGAISDRLVVLAGGELEVVRADASSPAPVGAVFGASSLLSRQPESATARARSQCTVLALPGTAFRELIMTYPMLLEQVSQVVGD